MHHFHWVVAELQTRPSPDNPTLVLRVRGVSSDKSIRKCGGSSHQTHALSDRLISGAPFWQFITSSNRRLIVAPLSLPVSLFAIHSLLFMPMCCPAVGGRIEGLAAFTGLLIPAPFSTGGRTPFVTADKHHCPPPAC